MIVPMKEILIHAKKNAYGIAAPNVIDAGTIRSVFEVAQEMKAPIIIDCAGYDLIEIVGDISRFYERKYPNVNVALNLDHGATFEEAVLAIKNGFSSVMVDRSQKPYEENVREVKEIVKIAHAVNVSVEAELGHVGIGSEYEQTRDEGLTNPDEAVQFVKDTGIDCLAVAIGTSHGTYKGTPKIDFELLQEIKSKVEIPLVLHGGSGTGDENLAKCIEKGIQKVNLFTDLSNAAVYQLNNYLEGNVIVDKDGKSGEFAIQNVNLYDAFETGIKGYKEKLEHYVRLFGSVGKA
ncbi:class II fructose-bisphosphate aldolase [Irregularibacter muris]|uniref:Class II fructose-bisphosphate aldolase n=1 Tax=Irregularibacter muris TaxID=1796619 RepID=A0AAE3HEH8_9FIRM|nr:class II fructose-bisphosphate aldolase [Irregularibacter muris]MCR1897643.1 class II fructose-bisphosphate aldolase [Irregularibacter muris]